MTIFYSTDGTEREARQRKKRSRWGGSENDKTFIPGMPTILPASLDSHQQEAYLGNCINHFTLYELFNSLCLRIISKRKYSHRENQIQFNIPNDQILFPHNLLPIQLINIISNF